MQVHTLLQGVEGVWEDGGGLGQRTWDAGGEGKGIGQGGVEGGARKEGQGNGAQCTWEGGWGSKRLGNCESFYDCVGLLLCPFITVYEASYPAFRSPSKPNVLH